MHERMAIWDVRRWWIGIFVKRGHLQSIVSIQLLVVTIRKKIQKSLRIFCENVFLGRVHITCNPRKVWILSHQTDHSGGREGLLDTYCITSVNTLQYNCIVKSFSPNHHSTNGEWSGSQGATPNTLPACVASGRDVVISILL